MFVRRCEVGQPARGDLQRIATLRRVAVGELLCVHERSWRERTIAAGKTEPNERRSLNGEKDEEKRERGARRASLGVRERRAAAGVVGADSEKNRDSNGRPHADERRQALERRLPRGREASPHARAWQRERGVAPLRWQKAIGRRLPFRTRQRTTDKDVRGRRRSARARGRQGVDR